MVFISHQSIPLFYCPSQVIFCFIILLYSSLLHLILFLSRFSFHSSLYHCAPDKNISHCHPDSASNMPQSPATKSTGSNKSLQTQISSNISWDFLPVIANSVNIFGKSKSKVQGTRCGMSRVQMVYGAETSFSFHHEFVRFLALAGSIFEIYGV